MALIRTGGGVAILQIPKGKYIDGGTGGVLDEKSYTSGTAITWGSSLGVMYAISPNTSSTTIQVTLGGGQYANVSGYKNGVLVDTTNPQTPSTVTTLNKTFTGCDLIIFFTSGTATTGSLTITDN